MPRDNLLTSLPYGLPGRIYRSPLPFSPFFDRQGLLLDDFILAGVDMVVMLTPLSEVEELIGLNLYDRYRALGFDVIYAPVEDFSIPSEGGFQEPIQATLKAAKDGMNIVIHCHAGLGRSGMFAACLAKVVFNMDGEEAANWVRQQIPQAVETWEQHQFIVDFKYELD